MKEIANHNELQDENIVLNICIPVYRTEKYLDYCIQSVLDQDYGNYRMVLVDDGSPDRCGEICDRYASIDSRIFVIHQENKGQIAARQAALRLIQAKTVPEKMQQNYVIFLDSDDTLKPYALKTIADHILKSGCDMLIYGIDWVRDGNVVGKFHGNGRPFEGEVTDKATLYQIILGDMYYNSLCRKVIAVELTLEKDCSQYSYLRHGEDLLQSLDYLKDVNKAVFIDDSLYNYTINDSSTTHSLSADNYSVDTTVREVVLEFIERENVWDRAAYDKYYTYCRKLLFNEIIRVSNFRATHGKKIDLLEKLGAEPYYQKILSTGCNLGWILKPMEQKQYGRVIVYAEMYEFLRSTYKKLRQLSRAIAESV